MRVLALAVLCCAWLWAATVHSAEALAQAKQHFSFGVRAYEAGRFRAAAAAFDKAYELAPRPAILFSCAQALRRQYALDRQPADLLKAVDYYRRYVEQVKEGGRRADAAAALSELMPMAERLAAEAAPAPEKTPRSVIMASSSVKQAIAVVDGGKPVRMPLNMEVTPGKHTVRISAEGYQSDEREIDVPPGDSYAIDAQLVALPVWIAIRAPDGSEVQIDGRYVGDAPLAAAIEMRAGLHRVSVTRRGHQPFVADVTLERGDRRTLEVELTTTHQRRASYALLGAGGAGIAAGVVLAALAAVAQSEARSIDEARATRNISEAERLSREEAVARRNDFRVAAGAAFVGGALVAGIGGALFLFDAPAPSEGNARVSASPAAQEAELGASLEVRF